MKRILSIFLTVVIACSLFAQGDIRFNFHTSALYATYDFVIKLSDSYPDNELKALFRASDYNTDHYRKLITDFDQLKIDYSYAFRQYPATLKAGVMSRDLLERNLAVSKTIDEFRDRSMGILPNEQLSKLAAILECFLPVYQTLAYEPNRAALDVQKEHFLKFVDNNSFSDYFQTGLSFYGTQWDSIIPIELNLLLSPGKGNLGARAFNNTAICEVPPDFKDHITFFVVAMHEINHIIYDNQGLEMKDNIQKWFDASGSPNSQYALLLMNEVLATALSSGYAMEQQTGKADEQEWYANKYISEMARAIYPVVKQYIQAGKPMDEAFIKAYVTTYDTQFPQWGKELAHLFTYRYIVTGSEEDWRYFRRTYRYNSYSRFSAPITAAEIEKAKEAPVTKVFIISKDHKQILDMLKANFPELGSKNPNHKKEFIMALALEDKTKLFIINRHRSSTEEMMKKYFPKNLIE
ncbi:hypothetical protein [Flavobacterium subsaxonicum]|uniref:hypothetical protein n=1 Tax=Flavobacterium subsaxonicum TaxID=426226 RepID=UPI00041BA88E|nr:hypothetical protein [Flavobacterium subsaxonicum]